LVLSVKNRFTAEEAAALETLQMLFGEKILNYMVVIFTGGDELEENEQTLEDYLRESPPALQVSFLLFLQKILSDIFMKRDLSPKIVSVNYVHK
jgi:hypothetical protein